METQFKKTVDVSNVIKLSDYSEAIMVKTENQESPLEVADVSRVANVQQSNNLDSTSGVFDLCLPAGWIDGLPALDQQWISKALFKWSQTGQPELDFTIVDKLWWYPPQPSPSPNSIPTIARYFGHPLFLWMPVNLWHVRLVCPHEDCLGEELTTSGIHQRVKRVVSFSSSYFMATEELSCKGCNRKMTSWSHNIVCQLDISQKVQFPCLLTAGLACDMQVVRQLRHRGPRNSISQIQRLLDEEHTEAWLQKQICFLTDFRRLVRTVVSGLDVPVTLGELPAMPPVPKPHWLMQAYAQDVLRRLEETQASITSKFGQVLRMNSSYRIVKTLALERKSTVSWATSVINEQGQVIMSVLTANEGCGLEKMVAGVVSRYQDAHVLPPKALYVDRDCCGTTPLQHMLRPWQNTEIRLDIRHFMQRIAAGCTSDRHALYSEFTSRLCHCIFLWDDFDVGALKEAKRAELEAWRTQPSDADILRHITTAELALHCKRTTRQSSEMEALIAKLIQFYDGEKGRDPLGVPLIDSARMAEIWKAQKKHLRCIQDPPGVGLYMQTGTLQKGGHSLPTYKCARESTSLERFHRYLNKFIPGTLATATLFQAYLVEGIGRWNKDRSMAAEGSVEPYNGPLGQAVNELALKLMGKTLVDCTCPPKYTGEPMGVEYFYDQQGYGQEDCLVTPSELETEEVTVAEEEEDDYMNSVELEDPTVFRLEESELPSALTSSNRATSRSPVSVSHLPSSTTEAIASTAPALPVQSFPVSSLTTAALSSKSCDVPSRSSAPSTTTIKPIACKPILPMQLTPFTTSTTPAIMPGAVKPHPVLSAGPVPHSAVPVLLLPMQNPETPGSRLTHRLLLPATPGPLQVLSVPHTSQHYRKRKLDKARAGIHVRSHVRRSSVSVCKQCQKDRKASTHVQYYGNWYCEETATVKLSEWRKRLAAKGYGKRKGTR